MRKSQSKPHSKPHENVVRDRDRERMRARSLRQIQLWVPARYWSPTIQLKSDGLEAPQAAKDRCP